MSIFNGKYWPFRPMPTKTSSFGGDRNVLGSTPLAEPRDLPGIRKEDAGTMVPEPKRRVPVNVVAGTASLGLKVHQHLAEAEPERNLVVSPVSLQLALAMAATGAKGETREEIARALGSDRVLAEDWHFVYANLLQTLRYGTQEQQLTLANSAWITSKYRLSPDFEQAVSDTFDGEAKALGGANPAAQINAWAAEKTGGKITQMLPGLSDEQRLMLMSCVYFQGFWATPFEERETKPRTFHAPSGAQQRPFMHMRDHFNYFEDANIQAISLYYSSRGGPVCLVVLPSRELGLREFLRRLEPSYWYSVRNAMQFRRGSLALPRFRVEGSKNLTASLQAAGIRRAFDRNESDFSGMLCEPDPLWIDAAQQNTYLEVNEKGTEAAAATSFDMRIFSAIHPHPPLPPFEMLVDRPFFCAIGSVASGLVLFTASVWEV